jgi:hypothetical protein
MSNFKTSQTEFQILPLGPETGQRPLANSRACSPVDQKLPRHLTGSAAEIPPKAAAPVASLGFLCPTQMLCFRSAGEEAHRPLRPNCAVATDGREAEQGGPDLSPGPGPLSCKTLPKCGFGRSRERFGSVKAAPLRFYSQIVRLQSSGVKNGHMERLIGSLRRGCLDRMLIFGEARLRQILTLYASYYNESRTHLSLNKDTLLSRAVQQYGNIAVTPVLSGLHHRYARI